MIVSRRAPIYLPESQKLHYALSGAGLRDANLQNTGLHNVRLIDTGPQIKWNIGCLLQNGAMKKSYFFRSKMT